MKGKLSHLLLVIALVLPLLLASCAGLPFVGVPTINSFAASPASISEGNSSELIWSVSNATALIIDQGIGAVSAAGTSTVTPAATTTYTLTAVNSSGSITKSTTVTVSGSSSTTSTTTTTPSSTNPPPGPLPVVTINVNPGVITPAGSAVLSWDVQNSLDVVIKPGIGTVAPSGSRTVWPNSTTMYVITASNAVGTVSSSTQLIVGPPGATPGPGPNRWLGNRFTSVYHYPTCSLITSVPSTAYRWFDTVTQAQSAGYGPCLVCRPPR